MLGFIVNRIVTLVEVAIPTLFYFVTYDWEL